MSSHGIPKDEVRRRAEVRAKKAELRKLDASRALEAHQSAQAAEQAKTARLRALRLAKEAKDSVVADSPVSPSKRRKKTVGAK